MKNFFKNKLNIVLIVVLILLGAGIGYFAYTMFMEKDALIVPDFEGKQMGDVQTWCNENNLGDACIISQEYSDTVPANFVIYQSTKAEDKFEEKISFIISKGKDNSITIKLPKIDNTTTKEDIEEWVVENNLTHVKYEEMNSSDVEEGIVIKIAPTTITSLDQDITVYISSGEKENDNTDSNDEYTVVKEGAYLGLTVEQFKKKVEALGLKVGDHVTDWDDYSTKYEKDTIIWHGSGEKYVPGEGVRYSLSLGKGIKLDASKYLGMTPEKFEEEMEKLGLKAETDYDNDKLSDYDKGLIRWYKSDKTYVTGDVVYYSISAGKKITVDTEKYLGKSVDEFEDAMEELGLEVEHYSAADSFSDYEKGLICGYGSETELKKGDTIYYGLSLGKYEYFDYSESEFTNYNYEDFVAAIEKNNLKVGEVKYQTSETFAKGKVISIEAKKYKTGDKVNVVVSSGKEEAPQQSTAYLMSYSDWTGGNWISTDANTTIANVKNKLKKDGFTNYTVEGKNGTVSIGQIIFVEADSDDWSSTKGGTIPTNTKITIYVCNAN